MELVPDFFLRSYLCRSLYIKYLVSSIGSWTLFEQLECGKSLLWGCICFLDNQEGWRATLPGVRQFLWRKEATLSLERESLMFGTFRFNKLSLAWSRVIQSAQRTRHCRRGCLRQGSGHSQSKGKPSHFRHIVPPPRKANSALRVVTR